MQQEELTTSQLCLLDIVSRRQMTRQTNLWKPQGHGTHINITLWRGALRGGSSLDSHFHPQQSTLVPTWMPEVKTAFPRLRLIIQHRQSCIRDLWLGARAGDGLSLLLLQAEKCCSVQGYFQRLAENHGLLGTKAPHPHPRTYQAALGGGGSENLHLFISLLPSPFLLPHPPRLQGGRKSCIKCLERISS